MTGMPNDASFGCLPQHRRVINIRKKSLTAKINSSTMNLVTLSWVAFALICGIHGSHHTMYSNFYDYLNSLDDREAKVTGEDQDLEGSGAESPDIPSIQLPLRTGLTNSKEDICCSLGFLAGDKGYHCVVKFYYAHILLRNQNRAHNRKLGFYGHDSVSNYGTKIMRTFEQCVSIRQRVFHKCCREAATNRPRFETDRPHFDNLQRRRNEIKMSKIQIPRSGLFRSQRVPLTSS